jgi:WD40 repeat protein
MLFFYCHLNMMKGVTFAALLSLLVQVVTETELRPVWESSVSQQGISELDYSPDGKLLAAATFDAWIDVYNVEKGYQRIGKSPHDAH